MQCAPFVAWVAVDNVPCVAALALVVPLKIGDQSQFVLSEGAAIFRVAVLFVDLDNDFGAGSDGLGVALVTEHVRAETAIADQMAAFRCRWMRGVFDWRAAVVTLPQSSVLQSSVVAFRDVLVDVVKEIGGAFYASQEVIGCIIVLLNQSLRRVFHRFLLPRYQRGLCDTTQLTKWKLPCQVNNHVTLGQVAPPRAQSTISPAEPEKCVIEGHVVRVGDLAPLKKALVTLNAMAAANASVAPGTPRRAPSRTMTTGTDEDGHFCFRSLDPGQYQLSAARTGYVRQQYGQRAPNQPGTPLTLAEGQQISGISFRMVPDAVIVGKVLDEDGEPVPGVRISVLKWGYRNGRRQMIPAGPGNSTNDLGEYRVFGLAPGKYYVSATPGNGMMFISTGGANLVTISGPESDRGDVAYAPVFFPNTFDPAHATPIDVKGGDEIGGINFRLIPAKGVRVYGRVVMPQGKPMGIGLNLVSRDGFSAGPGKFASVDQDGMFEMRGVPPGSYMLVGMAGDADGQYTAREPLEVGAQDIEVTVMLHPSTEIAGRLILEGVQLTPATSRRPRFNIQLQSADSMYFGGGGTQVDSDLSFRLRNIAEGDYNVNVYGLSDDQYVRAVRFEGREGGGPTTPVHLRGRGPLEVIVSANGGRLEGTVVDDNHQPIPRARVVLVPAEEERRARPDAFKSAFSDPTGHYTLHGIAPGYYKLFAFENVDDGAYQDPEWLRAYERDGQSLRVDEGSRITQELKMIAVTNEQSQ